MRAAVFLAILALPLLEIALLIIAGQRLGLLRVLLIIVATAVLGVFVIQRNGFTMARSLADAMEKNEEPGKTVFDGALVAMAGAFLIAPGLITDTLGLVLLIPPLRKAIARFAARQMFTTLPDDPFDPEPFESGAPDRRRSGEGTIIEGDYERIDDRPRRTEP